MLEWSIPEAEDEDWINSCIAVSGTMASDASFANIYLLRNKYSTKISRYKDFIIRKYSGKGARCGYTFPLGKGDVAKALAEIEKDAKECGERLQFAFVTEEQKRRDTEVTKLLKAYVKTYEKKVERSSLRQDILFYTCLAIIGIFAIIFITAIIIAFLKITKVSYTGLATIITASVSFISLVIGLLTIITKYFFPESDEQYITKIVETIQQNDLENKKENAKNVNPIDSN